MSQTVNFLERQLDRMNGVNTDGKFYRQTWRLLYRQKHKTGGMLQNHKLFSTITATWQKYL
jgi:hypothetical protein